MHTGLANCEQSVLIVEDVHWGGLSLAVVNDRRRFFGPISTLSFAEVERPEGGREDGGRGLRADGQPGALRRGPHQAERPRRRLPRTAAARPALRAGARLISRFHLFVFT